MEEWAWFSLLKKNQGLQHRKMMDNLDDQNVGGILETEVVLWGEQGSASIQWASEFLSNKISNF